MVNLQITPLARCYARHALTDIDKPSFFRTIDGALYLVLVAALSDDTESNFGVQQTGRQAAIQIVAHQCQTFEYIVIPANDSDGVRAQFESLIVLINEVLSFIHFFLRMFRPI